MPIPRRSVPPAFVAQGALPHVVARCKVASGGNVVYLLTLCGCHLRGDGARAHSLRRQFLSLRIANICFIGILIIHIIGNVQWTYKIELSGASLRAAMTLTAGRGEAFWCNRAEPGVTPKHISQHFSKDLPSRHSSLLAAAHRISLLTLRGNR